MNFFQQIATLQAAGDWKITIAADKQDGFIVSVLFYNEQVGDDARKKVPPMLLKGTAQELDKGFFAGETGLAHKFRNGRPWRCSVMAAVPGRHAALLSESERLLKPARESCINHAPSTGGRFFSLPCAARKEAKESAE